MPIVTDGPAASASDINVVPGLSMPAGPDPYACAELADGSFLLSSTKYLLAQPLTMTFRLPRPFLDENAIAPSCAALEANTAYCETAQLPDARCPPVMEYFYRCDDHQGSICTQLFGSRAHGPASGAPGAPAPAAGTAHPPFVRRA